MPGGSTSRKGGQGAGLGCFAEGLSYGARGAGEVPSLSLLPPKPLGGLQCQLVHLPFLQVSAPPGPCSPSLPPSKASASRRGLRCGNWLMTLKGVHVMTRKFYFWGSILKHEIYRCKCSLQHWNAYKKSEGPIFNSKGCRINWELWPGEGWRWLCHTELWTVCLTLLASGPFGWRPRPGRALKGGVIGAVAEGKHQGDSLFPTLVRPHCRSPPDS
jgi:hypothetical protein